VLHIAQQMPLPLTISCSSESRLVLPFLVLPFWYLLTRVLLDRFQQSSKTVVCVCVCVCEYAKMACTEVCFCHHKHLSYMGFRQFKELCQNSTISCCIFMSVEMLLSVYYLHNAMPALYMLWHFHLCVCVSHACLVSKWLNILSKFFYHLITRSI